MVLAETEHFAPLIAFHVVLEAAHGNSLLLVAVTGLYNGY
jgi:hypothetical protein